MIKKLNNYLLVNYPIIWNTKVIPMLLVTALIHVCFYLMGLAFDFKFINLNVYSALNINPAIYLLSVLTTLLFLVLWLFNYLKNNAFKKIYPLSKKLLFMEYVFIFVLIASSIFYFKSYETGLYHNLRMSSKDIDVEKEKSVKLSAENFLPFELNEFYYRNICDSIDKRKFEDVSDMIYPNQRNREYYYLDEVRLKNGSPKYSYMYRCDFRYDKSSPNNKEKQWLKNKNTDSITFVIEEYLSLTKKYGGNYNLNVKFHVERIFKHSDYLIDMQIATYIYYDRVSTNGIYVDEVIDNAHKNISKSRKSNWNKNHFQFLFIWAFVLSILLFSFRLTNLKTWFVSLIGTVLLIVIFSVILSLGIKSSFNNDEFTFGTITISCFVFAGFTRYLMKNKSSKLLSGVFLNWAFFAFPFVLPFIVLIIRATYYVETYNTQLLQHPVVIFIDRNDNLLFYINFTLIFLAIAFLIIPLAYKWRSNPEE